MSASSQKIYNSVGNFLIADVLWIITIAVNHIVEAEGDDAFGIPGQQMVDASYLVNKNIWQIAQYLTQITTDNPNLYICITVIT